jgi:hypothetical protein
MAYIELTAVSCVSRVCSCSGAADCGQSPGWVMHALGQNVVLCEGIVVSFQVWILLGLYHNRIGRGPHGKFYNHVGLQGALRTASGAGQAVRFAEGLLHVSAEASCYGGLCYCRQRAA